MLSPTLVLLVSALTHLEFVFAQNAKPISTWPTVYAGQPTGDYSPEWQACKFGVCVINQTLLTHTSFADFKVTEELPGVNFALPNHYAGNIKVQRPNHDNNTLFFWGFEHAEGSLTAATGENQDAPWAIWLQGGYVACY